MKRIPRISSLMLLSGISFSAMAAGNTHGNVVAPPAQGGRGIFAKRCDIAPQGGTEVEMAGEYAKLQERAQALQAKSGKSFDPWWIKDIAAQRFIKKSDWQKHLKEKNCSTEVDDVTLPCRLEHQSVYKPAPNTWDDWMSTSYGQVQALADANKALTISAIKKWNQGALQTTALKRPGVLKTNNNYGSNTTEATALTQSEIQSLKDLGLEWTGTECVPEDMSGKHVDLSIPECKKIHQLHKMLPTKEAKATVAAMESGNVALDVKAKRYQWWWFACLPRKESNAAKNCGQFKYPAPNTVPKRFQEILNDFEERVCAAKGTTPPTTALQIGLELQRKIVALHPFSKGNGRASRWAMDYVLRRAGLPPGFMDDMDKDISTPLGDAIAQSSRSMQNNLKIMKSCIELYEKTAPGNWSVIDQGRCGMLR